MRRIYFTDRDLGKQFPAPLAEAGGNFVNALGRIEDFVATHVPSFIANVYRPTATELAQSPKAPGQVELWFRKR